MGRMISPWAARSLDLIWGAGFSVGGLMILVLLSLWFGSEKTYGDLVVTGRVEVHDGDTLFVDVPEWPPIIGDRIGVRILGIDTPELHDKRPAVRAKAIHARNVVESIVSKGQKVVLKDVSRDKYFRVDAKLIVDGKDVGELLLKRKLAHPYDGGTKIEW